MKIGFLLLTSPEHENTITVQRLCKGFLNLGNSVEIFLMEDGVLIAATTSGSGDAGFIQLTGTTSVTANVDADGEPLTELIG